MSFGGSPGDIITAGALALRAYRACRAAAGEFAEVTREVSAVSILVQDLEDQAASLSVVRTSDGHQKQIQLRSLIDGIIYPLRELEELATKYSSLSAAKKNNWERLQFATKNIEDIRTRLILHTSAAQSFLDGLTNRSIARIECESDKTNNALHRIEQILADVVKDMKHGGRDPSVVSDGTWSIWTELKRELRMEDYPVEVVQKYKEEIKQYLQCLLHDANLEGDLLLDESEDLESTQTIDGPQIALTSQMQETIPTKLEIGEHTRQSTVLQSSSMASAWHKINIRSLMIVLLFVMVLYGKPLWSVIQMKQSDQVKQSTTAQIIDSVVDSLVSDLWQSLTVSQDSTRTSMHSLLAARETAMSSLENTDHFILELKAGLFRNEHAMQFTCENMYQARQYIDLLLPLVDADLVDDSAIKIIPFSLNTKEKAMKLLQPEPVTCPAQIQQTPFTPQRQLAQLDGSYWDIYSPDPP